jgi:hypothetical protein
MCSIGWRAMGSSKSPRPSRPSIPDRVRLRVWVAAAGRCTFCNRLVLENEDLGEPVPIGELAHNIGWGERSPRGGAEDDTEAEDNLLLVCRSCHRPVDDGGVVGRYTVDELRTRKRQHEERIRMLTEIGADRGAFVVRMVGAVRPTAPELTRDTVLSAATAAGIYPHKLPGSHWQDIDLDLRGDGELQGPDDFLRSVPRIADLTARVHDGVRREAIERVAVFAIARIPLLVELGARLDDKLQTLVFHRHRRDDGNAWTWPTDPGEPVTFHIVQHAAGDDGSVALVVSLSGTIALDELPSDIRSSFTIYEIRPGAPHVPDPTLVRSPQTVTNFEMTARSFLARIESDHGKLECVSLFASVGVAPAVTLGRVLMPQLSPAWRVFDRDHERHFFEALEVRP